MKIALGGSTRGENDDAISIGSAKLIARRVSGLDKAALRGLSDSLRERLESGVVVLAAENDGKVQLLVSVTKDLTDRVKAGGLIKELAPIVGGGGGGRPDFAEAGGKDGSKIDELLAKASVTIRARLEAANPQQAADVPIAVREATQRARTAPSAITRETAIAHALVKSLYEDGRLDEHQVAAFAEAGKFDEANAAIAALANVTISIAENMMVETRAEGVMILAKVSGMSWSTVKAIIHLRDDLSGMEPTDLASCKATYERLRPSTAQQVLRFHRMQQTAAPAA